MALYVVDNVVTSSTHTFYSSDVCNVVIPFGEVRLLRSRRCKNNSFFAPVIPSSCVLLLFPEAVNATTKEFMGYTHFEVGEFLKALSSRLCFLVKSGAACVSTGSLVLMLECPTVEEALRLVNVATDVSRMLPSLWSPPLYCQAMLCDTRQTGIPRADELTRQYYYFPTCVLCADRLDKTLTGYQSTSLCRCADTGTHCCCNEKARCTVCQAFWSTYTPEQSNCSSSRKRIQCSACHLVEEPWICLICGAIGCSRYRAQHAKQHFKCTKHCFSMNLLTQEVWDYESDSFCHTLVLSVDRTTGSTSRIELPGREETALAQSGGTICVKKKTVSCKHDKGLSMSHTQYALMIKNELDSSRAILEANAIIHMAFVEASMELASDEKLTDAGPRASVKGDTLSEEESEEGQVGKGWAALEELHHERMALQAHIKALNAESSHAQDEVKEVKALHHQLLSQRVTESLEVERLIAEAEETLREIKANKSAAAVLRAQMGNDDGLANVVVLNGGSTGSSSKRKRKK